jgi:membrane protease YdiL (CAAX protease family)
VTTALGVWATLSFAAALYAAWLGLGGRRFGFTLAVFSLLLAGQIVSAAGNWRERIGAWMMAQPRPARMRAGWPTTPLAAWLLASLALLPLFPYLIYAAGTNTFEWRRAGLCLAYVILPALLLVRVRGAAPGRWEDYAAALLLWLPVEFRWLVSLWPYPKVGTASLGYVLTSLLAVNVAIVAFLLIRQLEGVGYRLAWGRGWAWAVGGNFLFFAAIAIPVGETIGFIHFDASRLAALPRLPLTAAGIFLFTAWPEEFLFRGLLQNLLTQSLRGAWAGWLAASVIFGLSHINNLIFPNWRYVLLATVAGLFYGRAWMKTGSIFASALVHTLVNTTWHLLFRTL